MVSRLPLTKGYVALVDDDLIAALRRHRWQAHTMPRTQRVYAKRTTTKGGQRCTLWLHREVLRLRGIDAPNDVDHINRNTLDCQTDNLRPATRSQNIANAGKRSTNTSGFKGVSHTPPSWACFVTINGKTKTIGHFNTAEEAARAYDIAAHRQFGEFACLNFPDQLAETLASPPTPRPLRVLGGRWSRRFDRCQRCGTIDHKHESNGLCGPCRTAVRAENRRAAREERNHADQRNLRSDYRARSEGSV